jgi:hypothetical protein
MERTYDGFLRELGTRRISESTHNSMSGRPPPGNYYIPDELFRDLFQLILEKHNRKDYSEWVPLNERWLDKQREYKFFQDLDGLAQKLTVLKLSEIFAFVEEKLNVYGRLEAIVCYSGYSPKKKGYSYHIIYYNIGLPLNEQAKLAQKIFDTFPGLGQKVDLAVYENSLRMLGCVQRKQPGDLNPRPKRVFAYYRNGSITEVPDGSPITMEDMEMASILRPPDRQVNEGMLLEQEEEEVEDSQSQNINESQQEEFRAARRRRTDDETHVDIPNSPQHIELLRNYDRDRLESILSAAKYMIDGSPDFLRDNETGFTKVQVQEGPGPLTLKIRLITNHCPIFKGHHTRNAQVRLMLSSRNAYFLCYNDSCMHEQKAFRAITQLDGYKDIFPDSRPPPEQRRKKSPREIVLDYLKTDIDKRSLKMNTSRTEVYEQVFTEGDLPTGFYQSIGTVEKYIFTVTAAVNDHNINRLRISNPNIEKQMIRELVMDPYIFDTMKFTPSCYAFKNCQVYGRAKDDDDMWILQAYPHTEEGHRDRVATNYFPDEEVDIELINNLQYVTNPFDLLFAYPQLDTSFIDGICKTQGMSPRVTLELYGLCLRIADRCGIEGRDRWARHLVLCGKPRTGKGELINLIQALVPSNMLGGLSNNASERFALETMYRGWLWVASDLKSNHKFDMVLWQNIVAGFDVTIAQLKGEKDVVLTGWGSHGVTATNEIKTYMKHDVEGSVLDRMLIAGYPNRIPPEQWNYNIKDDCRKQLPAWIIKGMWMYNFILNHMKYDPDCQRKRVTECLDPYWGLQLSSATNAGKNPLENFLESDWIEYTDAQVDPESYIPWVGFTYMLENWALRNAYSYKAIQLNTRNREILEGWGVIIKTAGSMRRSWPPTSARQPNTRNYHGVFLTNIKISDIGYASVQHVV